MRKIHVILNVGKYSPSLSFDIPIGVLYTLIGLIVSLLILVASLIVTNAHLRSRSHDLRRASERAARLETELRVFKRAAADLTTELHAGLNMHERAISILNRQLKAGSSILGRDLNKNRISEFNDSTYDEKFFRNYAGRLSSKANFVASFLENVSDVRNSTLLDSSAMKDMMSMLSTRNIALSSIPEINPAIGWFSSGFGSRKSPYDRMKFVRHTGVDIAGELGSPIMATADGVVMRTYLASDYGYLVAIAHGYGIVTRYAHLSKILVSQGQVVHRGEIIALMGSSGRSTGPHVHYEVIAGGKFLDPAEFMHLSSLPIAPVAFGDSQAGLPAEKSVKIVRPQLANKLVPKAERETAGHSAIGQITKIRSPQKHH